MDGLGVGVNEACGNGDGNKYLIVYTLECAMR